MGSLGLSTFSEVFCQGISTKPFYAEAPPLRNESMYYGEHPVEYFSEKNRKLKTAHGWVPQKYIFFGWWWWPKICLGVIVERLLRFRPVSLPNQQSDCEDSVGWLYRKIFFCKKSDVNAYAQEERIVCYWWW
jgi:hypothetical protein